MDKKSITLKKAKKLEAIKPFGLVIPRGFSPQGMPVAGGLKWQQPESAALVTGRAP